MILPPLPSFILIFMLFRLSSSQNSIPLPFDEDHDYSKEILLDFNDNITLPFKPEGRGSMLIQFFSSTVPDTDKNGLPNILLSASLEDSNPEILDGREQKSRNDRTNNTFKCTPATPCFAEGFTVDTEAFFNRYRSAFLHYEVKNPDETVFVHISNFDTLRTVRLPNFPEDKEDFIPKPSLNGSLRISLTPNKTCPSDSSEKKCSSKGECENGVCQCEPSFQGRFCDIEVLTNESIAENPLELSKGEMLANFSEEIKKKEALPLEIKPFTTQYIRWEQTEGDSSIIISAVVLKGAVWSLADENDRNGETNVTMYATTKDKKNLQPWVKKANVLGPAYLPCRWGRAREKNTNVWDCYEKDVKKGNVIHVAFSADATGSENSKNAVVAYKIYRCDGEGLPECPVYSFNIPWLVLPVSVVVISVTGVAVLVMLWLDRTHGLTSSTDKLSTKELDRMYPVRKFGDPTAGEQVTEEEEECLICLSKFERDDVVRYLHCGHVFHAECIDPWLTENNATCPTCRADARLEHLSDKRILKRAAMIILWPVVLIRRRRERRIQEREREEMQEETRNDIEMGDVSLDATNALDESRREEGHIYSQETGTRVVDVQGANSDNGQGTSDIVLGTVR